jgi:cation:H+ antiporter
VRRGRRWRAALLVAGGHIGRPQGGLLLAAYLAGVALPWRREREPPAIGEAAEAGQAMADAGSRNPLLGLGLAAGGIALMAAGGWLAVGGA